MTEKKKSWQFGNMPFRQMEIGKGRMVKDGEEIDACAIAEAVKEMAGDDVNEAVTVKSSTN